MQATIEDNQLVVRIDLNDPPQPSASGKSMVVANSYGPRRTSVKIGGKNVTVNLSAWIKIDKPAADEPPATP